jgi:UDP-glucose 4-epimerase
VRTLVTGGAGFIGSTLVDRLLAEGHEVEVLDDLSSGSLANLADARAERTHRLTFHQIDVVDERAVDLLGIRAPEVVYHLAGRAGVRRSLRRPLDDATVNVVGTLNVLEGARRAGARKVVVAASGGTAYGEVRPRNLPAKESHALAPRSPHGVSTQVALEYLRLYRQLHDLEYTALALANVYGPRQRPAGAIADHTDHADRDGHDGGVIATFAARLLGGEECTILGDGEQTRDFLYVDDCVDAFVRAAERGDGLVINIGTGVETSVNELYLAMAGATGVDRPPRQAAAHAGEVQRSALDAGRAAIQLGWRPWTPVEEGVARVLEWHAGQT